MNSETKRCMFTGSLGTDAHTVELWVSAAIPLKWQEPETHSNHNTVKFPKSNTSLLLLLPHASQGKRCPWEDIV